MTTTENPFAAAEFAPNKLIRYEVTNRITGRVTSYKTSRAASDAMDRIDNAYGAVICTRRTIWAD